MAGEKGNRSFKYGVSVSVDTTFQKELQKLKTELQSAANKMPELDLKVDTDQAKKEIQEFLEYTKRLGTLDLTKTYREVLSLINDSTKSSEQWLSRMKEINSLMQKASKLDNNTLTGMTGFNESRIAKTISLYSEWQTKNEELEQSATKAAEAVKTLFSKSQKGNTLNKIIDDKVYKMPSLDAMGDGFKEDFQKLSDLYLTSAKNSDVARKNLEQYTQALLLYRSIVNQINETESKRIAETATTSELKTQVKDVNNLVKVLEKLGSLENSIYRSIGPSKQDKIISDYVSKDTMFKLGSFTADSAQYENYINKILRSYETAYQKSFEQIVENLRGKFETYINTESEKIASKTDQSVTAALEKVNREGNKLYGENRALGLDAFPELSVQPKIDIQQFFAEAQAQINASGKTLDIPVSISDDLSEISKQIDSLTGKLKDTAKLSIKLDIPDNLNTLSSIFSDLKIDKSASKNIDKLSSSLSNLGDTLSHFSKKSKDTLSQLSNITSKTSELENLSKVTSALKADPELKSTIQKGQKETTAPKKEQVDKAAQAYKELTKELSSYYKIQKKIDEGRTVSSNEYTSYQKLQGEIQKAASGIKEYTAKTEEAKRAASEFNTELRSISQAQKVSTVGKLDTAYQSLLGDSDRMREISGYSQAVEEVGQKLQRLKSMTPIDFVTGQERDDWKQLNSEIEKSIKTLRSSKDFKMVNEGAVGNLQRQLMQFAQANSRLFSDKDLARQYNELADALRNLDNRTDFTKINRQLSEFRMNVMQADKMGKSFGDEWISKMRSLGVWMASFVSVFDLINMFQEGMQAVKEYDTALTNLAKVADGTTQQIREFGEAGYEVANSIGATNLSLIDAASEWARLGYSLKEVDELGRISTIYANVGELPAAEATNDLVSILKAYNMEASEALRITDSLNEVGNRYAVSSAELGEILKRSASALEVADVSFDQAIAMGTGMNEILQDAPKVGEKLLPKHTAMYGAAIAA